MKEVHFILQGKGGVGKSLIATLLAQFLSTQHDNVYCFDTDPVNQTFGRFNGLHVAQIDILTPHKNIDASKFDRLIEDIVQNEGVFVIDNGASTFVPLMSYARENNIIALFDEMGINVFFHVPVVGGQASYDTLLGLSTVLTEFNAFVYVWANAFWGAVSADKRIEDWKIIKEHHEKLAGIIHLKQYNPDTFGKDISKMASDALTLDEVMQSDGFGLMSKQRLKTFKNDIFTQLAQVYPFQVGEH